VFAGEQKAEGVIRVWKATLSKRHCPWWQGMQALV
jgi:hypothetical protein